MTNKCLNEQGEYLYGVLDAWGDVDKKGIRNTLEEAISCQRKFIIKWAPATLSIEVYQRGKLLFPSDNKYLNEHRILELLQTIDKRGSRYLSVYIPEMYSKLPYKKIRELKNIINSFLNQNIDNTGYYKLGKLVKTLELPEEEYMKYL